MHRRKKGSIINPVLILASVLIFMTGAGIFVYPAVSNYLAERRQAEAVRDYQEEVSSLEPQELSEELKRAQEYNKNLAEDEFHDPFLLDGKYVISPEYQEILNYTGDGIMGYVEIPDIDVNLPIYHGTSEEVLQDGAGHLEASSLPVGGEGTHAVISAHQVVKPDELDSLRVVDGQDLVTLLTCTPYAVNTHRLLVRGVRIPYEEAQKVLEDAEDENTLSRWVKEYAVSIAAGTVLLVLLVLAVKIRKRKRKRKKKRKKKHGKWKHRK